jgi:hypothetical protein
MTVFVLSESTIFWDFSTAGSIKEPPNIGGFRGGVSDLQLKMYKHKDK